MGKKFGSLGTLFVAFYVVFVTFNLLFVFKLVIMMLCIVLDTYEYHVNGNGGCVFSLSIW